jgi:thiol-disulfide isomerase/thioredoxin
MTVQTSGSSGTEIGVGMDKKRVRSGERAVRGLADPVGLGLFAVCGLMGWIGYQKHLKPVQPLRVNEDLSLIHMEDENGFSHSLATGEFTVLLVFNSTCGPCRRTAPSWAEWLSSDPPANVYAVSNEPLEVAKRFAEDFNLDVEVRHVPWRRTDRAAALYAQGVPAAVLLTPDGRVLSRILGGGVHSQLESGSGPPLFPYPSSRSQ